MVGLTHIGPKETFKRTSESLVLEAKEKAREFLEIVKNAINGIIEEKKKKTDVVARVVGNYLEEMRGISDAIIKAIDENCRVEIRDSTIKALNRAFDKVDFKDQYQKVFIGKRALGASFVGVVNGKEYYFDFLISKLSEKVGESRGKPKIKEVVEEIPDDTVKKLLDILEKKFLQAKSKK